MAPIVDVYLLALVSLRPNSSNASLANRFMVSDIAPKVTSTTFCTSARSDPNSMQLFPKLMIAVTERARPTAFPILLNAFFILFV